MADLNSNQFYFILIINSNISFPVKYNTESISIMEKIHFKVQTIGSSNGYNNNKFVYHDLVRIWPKWDDTRNDEKSIIVGLVHPDLIGTMAFNQNFAKMNKGDDTFDMKKYKEVPDMELRVNKNEIITFEYDSDSFDKSYSNQLWI